MMLKLHEQSKALAGGSANAAMREPARLTPFGRAWRFQAIELQEIKNCKIGLKTGLLRNGQPARLTPFGRAVPANTL